MLLFSLTVYGQSFEGVIEATTYTKSTKEDATVIWYVKDGNSKIEVSGTADGKSFNTTLLFKKNDPELHILTEINGSKAVYNVPQSAVSQAPGFSSETTAKIDKQKSIAGYSCFQVKIEFIDGSAECWVSSDLDINSESLPPSLHSVGIIGALKANGIFGMPLEAEKKNNIGEIEYSFQVKNITSQNLSESLFSLPTEYQSGEELLKKSVKVE